MDHNTHNDTDEKIDRLLGALAPAPDQRPDPRRALNRFKSQINSTRRDEMTVFGWNLSRKAQRVLAIGLGVLVFAGLLAIPQVRALASNFLSIFRVQRFVLVSVSEDRLKQINEAMGDGQHFGEQEMIKDPGPAKTVGSLDEAAGLVGFNPLRADASYGAPSEVQVSGEGVMRYHPDVKAIREVFTTLNLDAEMIPANLDGKTFDITVPAGVLAAYATPNKFRLSQLPSPTVSVPEGVDMKKLGEAMLQLLGMTPEEAARMSASIDWTTTLIVPVPGDLNSVREVTVRGQTGLLFGGALHPVDPDSGKPAETDYPVTVIWQADGYVFAAQGYNANSTLAFAETLK